MSGALISAGEDHVPAAFPRQPAGGVCVQLWASRRAVFPGPAHGHQAQDGGRWAPWADRAEEDEGEQEQAVYLLLPALHCHPPGGAGTTHTGQEEPVGPGRSWSCPFQHQQQVRKACVLKRRSNWSHWCLKMKRMFLYLKCRWKRSYMEWLRRANIQASMHGMNSQPYCALNVGRGSMSLDICPNQQDLGECAMGLVMLSVL